MFQEVLDANGEIYEELVGMIPPTSGSGNVSAKRASSILSDNDATRWASAASLKRLSTSAIYGLFPSTNLLRNETDLRAEVLRVPTGLMSVPSANWEWFAVRIGVVNGSTPSGTFWVLCCNGKAVIADWIYLGAQGSPTVLLLASLRAKLRNCANRPAVASLSRPGEAVAKRGAGCMVIAEWRPYPDVELVATLDLDVGAVYPMSLTNRARYFDFEVLSAGPSREAFARLNSLASFAMIASFDPQLHRHA